MMLHEYMKTEPWMRSWMLIGYSRSWVKMTGKRVEVHQPSDNSWHRGTVTEVFECTSIILVGLDNGRAKNLELGQQGIRFISQKQKCQ
ncbi:hypothetical protein ACH5RR_023381 [Cinchona calisaya]|uniref:Uncharacterized protein n=1 Tax=Cinchona calisaya TaxID=153742 RepID=A0ABD2ZAH8_9GENT